MCGSIYGFKVYRPMEISQSLDVRHFTWLWAIKNGIQYCVCAICTRAPIFGVSGTCLKNQHVARLTRRWGQLKSEGMQLFVLGWRELFWGVRPLLFTDENSFFADCFLFYWGSLYGALIHIYPGPNVSRLTKSINLRDFSNWHVQTPLYASKTIIGIPPILKHCST